MGRATPFTGTQLTGACMGCTIDTVNGPKRVCREGPVFGREEIKW